MFEFDSHPTIRTRGILAPRHQRAHTPRSQFPVDSTAYWAIVSTNHPTLPGPFLFVLNTYHVRRLLRRRHLGLLIWLDSHRPRNAPPPSLGVGDRIGEGDSGLVLDILPPDLAEVAFENMRKEVAWNVMYHRGMFSAYTAPRVALIIVRYQVGKCRDWWP